MSSRRDFQNNKPNFPFRRQGHRFDHGDSKPRVTKPSVPVINSLIHKPGKKDILLQGSDTPIQKISVSIDSWN